jgi:hypothetical protein
MKRFPTIGLVLAATLASSAMIVSAAQAVTAPFFSVGGTRLVAGKTHNIDARAFPGSRFTLSTPALGVSITCTSLSAEKGSLSGSNAGLPGLGHGFAVFSGCTVSGNGEPCSVVEPITTNSLSGELVESENGRQLLVEFKPTTGTNFLDIRFTGAGCTVKESTVSGSVAAEVLTDPAEGKIELGQTPTEGTSFLVNFPTTSVTEVLLINSSGTKETGKVALEAFTFPATLTGCALSLLASTKFEPERSAKWSPLP